MQFASMFLSMLPCPASIPSGAGQAPGPVVPTSASMAGYANSPTGGQAFKAQYVLYGPYAPPPPPHPALPGRPGGGGGSPFGNSGVQSDLTNYSFLYNQ
jgi:hypothetical protein